MIRQKKLSDDAFRSKVVIIPNQTFWNTMQVTGQTMQNILQGNAQLYAEIRIEYESNRREYYYKGRYEFNRSQHNWVLLDGDAN